MKVLRGRPNWKMLALGREMVRALVVRQYGLNG